MTADAPDPIPKPGERWRFVLPDAGEPDEEVLIVDDGFGYTGFVSTSRGPVIVYPGGKPACGKLEPLVRAPRPEPPRAKQHDEITLDEWRAKIRNMR